VVSFTPLPLYPRRKSPRCPLDRRLCGPHVDDVEKREFLTPPGLELRLHGRSAGRQSLYRLRYPSSHENVMFPNQLIGFPLLRICSSSSKTLLENKIRVAVFPENLDSVVKSLTHTRDLVVQLPGPGPPILRFFSLSQLLLQYSRW
jgi:hypothetical protein